MMRAAYPFGWMGVAVASIVALLLTHHRSHAAVLIVALLVLHVDFLRRAVRANDAETRPAPFESDRSATYDAEGNGKLVEPEDRADEEWAA